MNRRRSFLSIVLFCLILSPGNTFAQKHDFTQDQCGSTCHTDPRGGELVFLADIDSLCLNCHTLLDKNVHPSLFSPERQIPSELWLDGEGRLNCATCHDPHPDPSDSDPLLLRGDASGIDFCALCHERNIPHKGVTFVAHSKSYTSPESGGSTLDWVTQDCLACHDPSDALSGVCILGQEGTCGGHIIGKTYDQGYSEKLKPRTELSPYISLYEGKIGCASCHSIYSGENALLVLSNSSSALCLGCHKK